MNTALYLKTEEKIVELFSRIFELRSKNTKNENLFDRFFGEDKLVEQIAKQYKKYEPVAALQDADLIFSLRVMYEYLAPLGLSKFITNEVFDNNPQMHLIKLALASRKPKA